MVISQGELYWVDMAEPKESEPGYRHPFVIVQNDAFNRSNINTVVACSLTSNIKLASSPGNILLKKGDGNLPKASVVNISQVATINKSDLKQKIGKLSKENIEKIIEGIEFLLKPRIV
jgi:mRNA interferase MazF